MRTLAIFAVAAVLAVAGTALFVALVVWTIDLVNDLRWRSVERALGLERVKRRRRR